MDWRGINVWSMADRSLVYDGVYHGSLVTVVPSDGQSRWAGNIRILLSNRGATQPILQQALLFRKYLRRIVFGRSLGGDRRKFVSEVVKRIGNYLDRIRP